MEIFETSAGFGMSAQRKPELYVYTHVKCWLLYVHPAYITMNFLLPLVFLALVVYNSNCCVARCFSRYAKTNMKSSSAGFFMIGSRISAAVDSS